MAQGLDLIPRKQSEDFTIRAYASDFRKLHEMISDMNESLEEDQGEYLVEDVFSYLISTLEKEQKKAVGKTKKRPQRKPKGADNAARERIDSTPPVPPMLNLGNRSS